MLNRLARGRVAGRTAPVHPVLLAAFPVLFLFAENAEQQVTLAPLWMPLAVCLGASVALLLAASAAFRDWQRGALLASLLVVLFFGFGHAWSLAGAALGQRWLLAGVWIALAIIGAALIWRGGRWMEPIGGFLNVAGILLVAFNVFRVANYASASAIAASDVAPPENVALHAPATLPDVYYIILDRYAGAETLRDDFGYDNEPFLRELEKRGFAVARDSWANYFKTALSIYSSLSMDTISKEKLGETNPPYKFTSIFAALRDHLAVPTALKSLGYRYIHLGNWWEPTAHNVDADVELRFADSAEFAGALFSTTFLSVFSPPAGEATGDDEGETISRRDVAADSTLFTFDRLAEAPDWPGANYVFAHFLLPHPPYVFNAKGQVLVDASAGGASGQERYVQQVQFANQKVLATIDRLLKDPTEPVIVLQSDEGPYPAEFARRPATFDWLHASEEVIAHKFRILNAIHLPNGIDPRDYGFSDHTSPVNEFRVVFNAMFGAQLPLLPDMTYLSPKYARMYDFVEYPPR